MSPPETAPGGGQRSEVSAGVSAGIAAHQVLSTTVANLDDDTVVRSTGLAGWSVGHVLTHLARNADGHSRWLKSVLEGRPEPRYPGGAEQRDREIAAGARRAAVELSEDVRNSSQRLEGVWEEMEAAGWPDVEVDGARVVNTFATAESPWRRLLEVEVHLCDLGLGYGVEDWSEAFVSWTLPRRLRRLDETVTGRLERRRLLRWLVGRAADPGIGPIPF